MQRFGSIEASHKDILSSNILPSILLPENYSPVGSKHMAPSITVKDCSAVTFRNEGFFFTNSYSASSLQGNVLIGSALYKFFK